MSPVQPPIWYHVGMDDYSPSTRSSKAIDRWVYLCSRLPARIRYWVVVNAYARASWNHPQTAMGDLTFSEVLQSIKADGSEPQVFPKTWRRAP